MEEAKNEVKKTEFDYEHFDFESCFKEVRSGIKKPNILVCGATGVGKSSLVNDLLNLSVNNKAEVGDDGRPRTRGVELYTSEDSSINLYDSEGYEVGTIRQEYYRKEILGFIDEKIKEDPTHLEARIHEVWYCVSAGNKRFFDVDRDLIREIMDRSVPVMVLITKVDEVEEEELDGLKREIKRNFPKLSIFTYSTTIPDDEDYKDVYKEYVQVDKITEWAIDNLDESLLSGFLPAVKRGISDKRKYIMKKVVPMYAGTAGALVVGTSFVNVPFTDSAVLMPLQLKMAFSIISTYGIKADAGKVIGDVLSTSLVSYLGRTLATQIIGIIPFIGNVAKSTVNVSVATMVTAVLGAAISIVCEQYLKTCVDKAGGQKMGFMEFFTADRLKDALKYVKGHGEEFKIDDIVKEVVKEKINAATK
ncbi:MAG: 50S ribosome-binding GTPase [Lachnospiraceae bacterium]|nr:50S ribosome-binding GTPase [Lachnospiraceae bacterium]